MITWIAIGITGLRSEYYNICMNLLTNMTVLFICLMQYFTYMLIQDCINKHLPIKVLPRFWTSSFKMTTTRATALNKSFIL